MTYNRALHLFLLLAAAATFLLIVAGGLVTSTQSGLSVPDWPNTYGHFMFSFPLDKMIGGILYEHGHRMIATVVGFLILVSAFWLWRREKRRWVRNLGFFALAAVIVQGLLGGLTVLFLLPTAVSVSHATLAQTVFSIMVALSLFTSRWWMEDQPPLRDHTRGMSLVTLSALSFGAIFIQLILGALMRHMHAGLAVPDFPLIYGQLIPSLSPQAMQGYNNTLAGEGLRTFIDGPVTRTLILIHVAHRAWALVVAVCILLTTVKLFRLSGQSRRLMLFQYLMIVLLVIQMTLGGYTVLSRKAVDIATAHVATGALLLAMSVLLALHAIRLYGIRSHPFGFLRPGLQPVTKQASA